MTVAEANRIKNAFYGKSAPTEEDVFLFTEALDYLIEETKNPQYMMELGGFYYGERKFNLALKYYDLAAEHKYVGAYDALGYIWYYGRIGTRDYEKAFRYFTLSAESGNLQAAYKLADMYKNGYYVEKDYEKYKQIIEELYPKVKNEHDILANRCLRYLHALHASERRRGRRRKRSICICAQRIFRRSVSVAMISSEI